MDKRAIRIFVDHLICSIEQNCRPYVRSYTYLTKWKLLSSKQSGVTLSTIHSTYPVVLKVLTQNVEEDSTHKTLRRRVHHSRRERKVKDSSNEVGDSSKVLRDTRQAVQQYLNTCPEHARIADGPHVFYLSMMFATIESFAMRAEVYFASSVLDSTSS